MTRVKIYGAGSIGNHLAHAARTLGWEVTVCDVEQAALDRMKGQIYPGRYGQWDSTIQLSANNDAPKGGFDWVFIGTPPEHHLPLALEALAEKPKGILIEKPLCTPDLQLAQEFWDRCQDSDTQAFVGYTHTVGRAAQETVARFRNRQIGTLVTLDVEFREHWEGIFTAHPWLRGPEDTYLGYWKRGGGASGEHSHALNLWQYLAQVAGAGRVIEVSANLQYKQTGRALYDSLCLLNLRTEKGLEGRVVQDVVTRPSRKRARLQGTDGALEWAADLPGADAVIQLKSGQPETLLSLPKKRPDDFIEELKHLEKHLGPLADASPLSLERGLDSMLVLAAAHLSEQIKSRIQIDYSKGYRLEALRPTSTTAQPVGGQS